MPLPKKTCIHEVLLCHKLSRILPSQKCFPSSGFASTKKKAALAAADAKAAEQEPGYQALLAEAMALENPNVPLGSGLVSVIYHILSLCFLEPL